MRAVERRRNLFLVGAAVRWIGRLLGLTEQIGTNTDTDRRDLQRRCGYVEGRHYSDWFPEVVKLKRLKKHVKAIELLWKLVESTEEESSKMGCGVAPAYYRELAIIFRKEKRYEEEVSVLERYMNQRHAPGVGPGQLSERLEKARALLAKASGA